MTLKFYVGTLLVVFIVLFVVFVALGSMPNPPEVQLQRLARGLHPDPPASVKKCFVRAAILSFIGTTLYWAFSGD